MKRLEMRGWAPYCNVSSKEKSHTFLLAPGLGLMGPRFGPSSLLIAIDWAIGDSKRYQKEEEEELYVRSGSSFVLFFCLPSLAMGIKLLCRKKMVVVGCYTASYGKETFLSTSSLGVARIWPDRMRSIL